MVMISGISFGQVLLEGREHFHWEIFYLKEGDIFIGKDFTLSEKTFSSRQSRRVTVKITHK